MHLQPFLWEGLCISTNISFLPIELRKARRNPMFQMFIKMHWDYWREHFHEYTDVEGYTNEVILSEVKKDFDVLNFDGMFGISYSLEYFTNSDRLHLLNILVKAALAHFVKAQGGNLFYAKSVSNKRLQGVTGKSSYLRYILSLLKSIGPFLVLPGIILKSTCSVESAQDFYAEILHGTQADQKRDILDLILLICPNFVHDPQEHTEPGLSIELQFNTLAIDHTTQFLILKKLGDHGWTCLRQLHMKLMETVKNIYLAMTDTALPSDDDLAAILNPENAGFIDTPSVVPSTFDVSQRISLLKFIWFRSNITAYNSEITVSFKK